MKTSIKCTIDLEERKRLSDMGLDVNSLMINRVAHRIGELSLAAIRPCVLRDHSSGDIIYIEDGFYINHSTYEKLLLLINTKNQDPELISKIYNLLAHE